MGKKQTSGATATLAPAASLPQPGSDSLWIGKHSIDGDLLVFDPTTADAGADPLSFYSLNQHRRRAFPRSIVERDIREVTDEIGSARAKKDYAARAETVAQRASALNVQREESMKTQREGVVEAHRRYLEQLGIEYAGVQETASLTRKSRRTKCHACGIALDDFAGVACGVCDGVLCSCGSCACGSPSRAR